MTRKKYGFKCKKIHLLNVNTKVDPNFRPAFVPIHKLRLGPLLTKDDSTVKYFLNRMNKRGGKLPRSSPTKKRVPMFEDVIYFTSLPPR